MKQPDLVIKPTLTPDEAVRLANLRPISDFYITAAIYSAFYDKHKYFAESDSNFFTVALLATCWNAGRIEGIRAERAKRKAV